MNVKGHVKEDGTFKFYEQESSQRGLSYHARPKMLNPLPTRPCQLVNLVYVTHHYNVDFKLTLDAKIFS